MKESIEIGRYRVQSHLARGGMADVYLAHDSESNRIVALKMVHESAGDYSERFQREVKVMSGLVHEHILPALDYGQHESWYFLVTPYVEYGTLNGRLKAGPLTLEEVDPILAQLAEALQFAHEQGIVHRDVKPSNVLMRDGHHVYLADFGLVKRVGQENGLTVTGYLIGTPEYMAPELAEEDATPQSDVYALGVLLYQMLVGRVPFKANTPMGVFLRHIRDTPEPPSMLNPAIPAQVEEVILRAMEKDPQKRYRSVQELYQAYQQAVKDAAISQQAVADQPTLIPHKQFQIDDGNKVEIRVRRQRGKGRSTLLAVALVIILLLGGVFVLVNSTFAPGDRGNSIHAADARDAKDRQTSTPAVKRTTPGSTIDSAASKRPTTGASGAIVPTSPANLSQSAEPSTPQQTIIATGGSVQSGDNGNAGGQGQGTTNDPGNVNSVGGQGGGGQSAGSGGSQGNGNGGGQSAGSGGDQGNGNGGGQSAGSGGDQGNGSGNGNDQGNGNGGGDGQGKGKGNGNGKGQDNGNGNGKGKGQDKGKGGGD